jgi:transposase
MLTLPTQDTCFPEDLPSLQSLVREQHSCIRALREQLRIEKLGRERAELKVKDLLRRIFGPKSEKLNALQGLLFSAATAAEQAAGVAREALKRSRAALKRVYSGTAARRASPENLPILETVRIDLPEEQKAGLVWMRDEISYEQDYQPSQFFRRAYVRSVYAHPQRLHGPVIAPLPARVIPQSKVGPGFLAHMLVSKYVDHVPYYRQQRIDQRGGLWICDKARVRYTEQCALLLLTIYHQLIGRLLSGGYVSADETTVKLLDPDRPHKARDAWLWTYLGPTVETIVFQFSLTRGAENPQAVFPKNWCGALQVDGYRVYTSLAQTRPGIVLFGCWTHARRGVVEALKSGEQKAMPLLRKINELYAIETETRVRGYTPAQRSYYRYGKCRPVFKRLKARFEELKRTELPSSHLGEAAKYVLNRWSQLVRYAKPGYGHINIDQNPVESQIRPTKIGAKNWMHIGHPKAGWRSAVIYSIVGTCRLLEVDPFAYLRWVLPRLAAATTQTATGLLPHDYARLHPQHNTS